MTNKKEKEVENIPVKVQKQKNVKKEDKKGTLKGEKNLLC